MITDRRSIVEACLFADCIFDPTLTVLTAGSEWGTRLR